VTIHPFKDSSVFNYGKVNENIYRGSQPYEKDYLQLKRQIGIVSILDLNDSLLAISSSKFAKTVGLIYYNVPMSNRSTPRLADVKAAIAILKDSKNWPVFVHCEGGRHRSGLILAVYRVVVTGWTKEQAWEEAKQYDWYSDFGHEPLKDWFFERFYPVDFQ